MRMISCHTAFVLAIAADRALQPVLQHGARAFGQAKPNEEVGFVAAAVLGGVPRIARAWRPILRKESLKLTMHGVFCHQSPKATFNTPAGAPQTCELADLLIVVEDLTKAGPVRRWAVLIQAKMAGPGGGKTLSDDGDKKQLRLMSHWPQFRLAGGFDTRWRDFSTCRHPGTTLQCGHYGLITKGTPPLWHQQSPSRLLVPQGLQLGAFMAMMLDSPRTGCGREATGTGNDWSSTVEDLMQRTYANVFSHKAGFGAGRTLPRGHTAFAYYETRDTHQYSFWPGRRGLPLPSGGKTDRPREETAPQEDGISLIRIGITRD